MTHGKHLAQSYEEMTLAAESKKSGKIYREESGAYVDGEISRLVSMATEELARIADGIDVVSLDDTETVKTKSIEYLRVCSEQSIIPTMTAFCHVLGYSEEGVRQFRIKHQTHQTSEFLQLFHEKCAEALNQAALRGYTNHVYSIFAQKAKNSWKDTYTFEPSRADNIALDENVSAEIIARKYVELPSD